MILNGRILTTLVMFAIFSGMSILALGFPPQARFMPLLIGIPGAVLCAAQLVFDLRHGAAVEPNEDSDDEDTHSKARPAADPKREIHMFFWLAAFIFALLGFGFLYGGPAIVFLYLKVGEKESWFTALFAGVGTFVTIYGMFVWLLELPIFEGFILERLLG